jgi:NTP pyrophosphatase (non-canonical NTP hydrolase)
MRYGTVVTDRMFVREYNGQIDNCIFGLCGEVGEIADHFKKMKFHPPFEGLTEEGKKELRKEIGDVLWYLAALNELVFEDSLVDVARDNIKKLAARYPEKYSDVDLPNISL